MSEYEGVKCPKCKSYNVVEKIGGVDYFEEGPDLIPKELFIVSYPNRPAPEFYCWECGYTWENPEYIEWLYRKCIKK